MRAARLSDPRLLGIALAFIVFLWSWSMLGQWFYARHERQVGQNYDVAIYKWYAHEVRAGKLPYRDFAVVYPPGGLPAFVAPSYLASDDDPGSYNRWFSRLMAGCGLACLCFMLLVRPPPFGIALFAVSPLLLGSLMLARFDLWPTALVAGAVAALVHDRHVAGFVALAAAFAAKLFAGVLLPLAFVWTLRTKGLRAALLALAAWVLVVAAAFTPFAILAPDGFWASFHDQVTRAIQIESLVGTWVMTFGDSTAVGSLGAAGIADHHALARISTVTELVVLLGLWIGFARGPMESKRLVRYAAACVCAFIAFGTVLSPQYLIWLLPLVPLVRGVRGLIATALLAVVLVATQYYYPDHYDAVIEARLSWFVLIRNLLLIVMLAVLALPVSRRIRVAWGRRAATLRAASSR
jgi:hypothetical protein